jgi:hypothetical protein
MTDKTNDMLLEVSGDKSYECLGEHSQEREEWGI